MQYPALGGEETQSRGHRKVGSANNINASSIHYHHLQQSTNDAGSWPLQDSHSTLNGHFTPIQNQREGKRKTLKVFWPTLAVVLPMTLFSAVTLGLVYGYRVNPRDERNDFLLPTNKSLLDDHYIYVNFSATRLVFITSWSSSFAPVLIGFLMVLWQAPLALQILEASQRRELGALATPYQLSLIINMATGSLSQLFAYLQYFFSHRKVKIPSVLTRTALVMSAAGLLSLAIFAADTAVHCTTKTVPYQRQIPDSEPSHTFGRGVSEECLKLDRSKNNGFPCPYYFSYDDQGSAGFRKSSAIAALRFNDTNADKITFYTDSTLPDEDLQILLPSEGSRPPQLDYSASTIGVGTKCTPMTNRCDMRINTAGTDAFFQFNCTDDFWGTLGGQGNPDLSWVTEDPDIPPFSIKDSSGSLQFGYYSDPSLTKPYNTYGIDGSMGFWYFDNSTYIRDKDLINPIPFAVAGTLSYGNSSAADALIQDGTFVRFQSGILYALNCTFATYDVTYTWANNSLQPSSTKYKRTPNGTVAEIFHGIANQVSPDYLQGALLASLQNTSAGFARTFADSHSTTAMTVIGSVLSPRRNIAQTRWEHILVARVQAASLWCLVAANMLFAGLGLGLAVRAYLASSSSAAVVEVGIKVSTAGVTAAAFAGKSKNKAIMEEGSKGRGGETVTREEDLFGETGKGERADNGVRRRVGAVRGRNGEYELVAFE
ncbi:MAG: hypothetical protein Q9227_006296 [Pyrenula ochraceoflavens]